MFKLCDTCVIGITNVIGAININSMIGGDSVFLEAACSKGKPFLTTYRSITGPFRRRVHPIARALGHREGNPVQSRHQVALVVWDFHPLNL
jgi:hypothetical protein